MFIRFGVCADVAHDDQLTRNPDDASTVRKRKLARLRDEVLELGTVTFANTDERARFLASLPEVEGRRWEELIVSRGLVRSLAGPPPHCACEQEDIESFRRDWNPHIDAVVCSTERAVLHYGLTPEDQPLSDDGIQPEVAGLAAVDALACVAEARAVARERVVGALREDVWTQRLLPAAAGARELTILDSYIAHEAARQLDSGKRDSAASPLSGIAWLVRRAVQAAGPRLRVRIYTRLNPTNDFDVAALESAVRQLFHQGLLENLQLLQVWDWAPWGTGPKPGTLMHQRLVCFDSRAVRLGNGTGLFAEQRISVDEACEPCRSETEPVFAEIEGRATSLLEWRRGSTWEQSRRDRNGTMMYVASLPVLTSSGCPV